jgi:alpha-glucuronidase
VHKYHIFSLIVVSLSLSSSILGMGRATETGYDAWLRYDSIDEKTSLHGKIPSLLVRLDDTLIIKAAEEELGRGLRGMLGSTPRSETRLDGENAILLGKVESIKKAVPGFKTPPNLIEDGYVLRSLKVAGRSYVVITATNDRGVLYGVFAFLKKIAMHERVDRLDQQENPYVPVRMLDHWDNLDGTIERGYAGPSIFFENDNVVQDLCRLHDYARLMASVGINGCSINNVNANTRVITPEFLPQLARVAEVFHPWGVKLFVSIDFSSPKIIGGLDTFDPLDARVADWWKKKVDEIYAAVPDFGGFVLKADSEGRLGPSAYGRSHADAANVIARPLAPHGGIIFYRGFVYDHHMDWRVLKNDRARAAYDNLHPLDGKFDSNVVLQIKYGPIDFQVREPASPLFGGLEKSNQAIELQITQEYTGQQRHICFLVPMWKEVLDFDMRAKGAGTPVKDLVSGRAFNRPVGGFVAVSNVGRDPNWLGHPMAMANLYGFGRLAWNPNLTSERIAEEWTRQTFGNDPEVVKTIVKLQLDSWPTYEKYTGPLGAGTLTDIIHVHYGPAPDSSERNGWGQWHRADEKGVGMDRTVETGTGYIGQYSPPVAAIYESLGSCPDDLLLFMHHVPYTYVLHSGKTVIQHIYDSHYEGAEEADGFVARWKSLKGKVDDERYRDILARLEYQAGHAEVWRDSVCSYFLRKSGIPDTKGRVGHFPGRVEAEAMKLDGYEVKDVVPWEAASGSKAVSCREGKQECQASFRYEGKAGSFDISTEYFDLNNGASKFKLLVGGKPVDEWTANDQLPSDKLNAHTSTRHTAWRVALHPGDEIILEGFPDGSERAPIDYVEIRPAR